MTREKSWRAGLYGIITVYMEKKEKRKEKRREKKRRKEWKTSKLYIRSENMNSRRAINIDRGKRNKLQDTYIVA